MCNGSTPDSDSVCEGSNPSSAAKATHHCRWVAFLFAAWHQNPNKIIQISARSAEGASRVRILHPLPKATHHCRWVAFLLAAWHQNKIKLSSPSDELSFTVGTFRTENIRRQLPRRASETIRDYHRICARQTNSGADETYPTLCSLCKRPEQPQGTAALQTV